MPRPQGRRVSIPQAAAANAINAVSALIIPAINSNPFARLEREPSVESRFAPLKSPTEMTAIRQITRDAGSRSRTIYSLSNTLLHPLALHSVR